MRWSWIIVVLLALVCAWLLLRDDGHELRSGTPDSLSEEQASAEPAGGLNARPRGSVGESDSAGTESPAESARIVTQGPGRVMGRVADRITLEPVTGAVVEVRPAYGHRNGWVAEGDDGHFVNRVVTDARGRFLADRLPVPSVVDLTVRHARHAYLEHRGVSLLVDARDADAGLLLLERSATLSGRVLDQEGRPLAAALVRAGDVRSGLGAVSVALPSVPLLRGPTARSGADGRFALEGLGPGFHRLEVRKQGFATRFLEAVEIPSDANPGPLEVVLARAWRFAGRVQRKDGGGLAGAVITVSLSASSTIGAAGVSTLHRWDRVVAGDGGTFELRDLPDHPGLAVNLRVDHPGYEPANVSDLDADREDVVVTLVPTAPSRGVRVAGFVADQDGRYIRDREVDVRISGPERTIQGAYDSRNGTFTIDDVPPGTWSICATPNGWSSGYVHDVVVDGPPQPVTVTVRRGLVVRGRVLDSTTREPVSGARVVREEPFAEVLTDADGSFLLGGFNRAGTVYLGIVTLQAEGYFAATPDIAIPQGANEAVVDLELIPHSAGLALRGLVLLPDGRPAPGARVALVRNGRATARTTTSIDGRFQLGALRPDQVTGADVELEASARGGAATRVPVSSGRAEHTIRLRRGRVLSGTVRTAAGRIVPTARVLVFRGHVRAGQEEVRRDDEDFGPRVAGALSDAKGRFRFEHMPEDPLTLRASSPRHRWLQDEGFAGHRVSAGGRDLTDLVIEVETGIPIEGRAVYEDGRPAAGVYVGTSASVLWERTSRTGHFRLPTVYGSGVALRMRDPFLRVDAPAIERAPMPLQIVVKPCGQLRLRLVDGEENGIGGAAVRLAGPEHFRAEAKSYASGHVFFERLLPGRYVVEVDDRRVPAEVEARKVKDLGPLVLSR